MNFLLGKTEDELIALAKEMGEAPFRGKQLYQSIYGRRVLEVAQMTELSKPLRDTLAENAKVTATEIAHVFYSTDDTRRYLFRLGY